MTATDKVFAGSVPAIYQQYMVPMLFEPYAQDVAARIGIVQPDSVLEIAAGTGVVTRALAKRLPKSCRIVATDLNQPMLDIAAGLQTHGRQVTFQQADALALPFDDGSFDLVVCQFGAMFFPDKLQAYREARRVLKTGGSYILSVWDELSANAFVTVVSDVLYRRFPDDPPKFMERTPHGYHDAGLIAAQMREAGFAEVDVETVTTRSRADSAMSAAAGYCQGSPLRGEIEARDPGGLQSATDAVASALEDRFGQGAIEGTMCALVAIARK